MASALAKKTESEEQEGRQSPIAVVTDGKSMNQLAL